MPRPRAQLPAVYFAAFAACACNDPDLVAHPISSSARTESDAAALSCDYAAQLARHKLPAGIANVFVDCEWPLTPNEDPDDLRWLIGEMSSEETAEQRSCALNPYYWWQEPPLPHLPQRFVYCPKACDAVKAWARCKLKDDPCSVQEDSLPSDAGAARCAGDTT